MLAGPDSLIKIGRKKVAGLANFSNPLPSNTFRDILKPPAHL
jgi:hypothetical protein